MSNRLSNRRGKVPKPAVCKKQPRLQTLTVTFHRETLADPSPVPLTEQFVIRNEAYDRTHWRNQKPTPVWNVFLTVTYIPQDYSFTLDFTYDSPAEAGGGGHFGHTKSGLKQAPAHHGTFRYEFHDFDPDFEPGFVVVSFP